MSANDVTASAEYVNLKNRLTGIRNAFKVDEFKHKEWSLLSDIQIDYARAYVALCHAEIESYLEQKAIYVIDKALEKWGVEKKVSLPLLALFAHLEFIEKSCKTEEKINMMVNKFKIRVRNNNGIKEHNIRNLFIPIGVDMDDIDTAWVSTLNSYGVQRGEAVHMSAHVQQPMSISDMIKNIEDIIVKGALDFEILLASLICN